MPAKKEKGWAFRCVERLEGQQTMNGSILIAALGYWPQNPPRISRKALITETGMIVAPVEDQHGGIDVIELTTVDQLTVDFSRLADKLDLHEAERVLLFKHLRDWCAKDLRPRPEPFQFTMHQAKKGIVT